MSNDCFAPTNVKAKNIMVHMDDSWFCHSGQLPALTMLLRTRLALACLLAALAACGGPPAKPARKAAPPLPTPDLNDRSGARIWEQLRQFHSRRDACAQALDDAKGWKISRMADTAPSPGCGLRGAVKVQASFIPISREVDVGCPMAAGLHLWMREHVQTAARLYLNAEVKSIETYGTYACRTRNNRDGARLSEHATANAIDISAFVLSNGKRLRVADMGKMSEDERDFMQSVRKGGCRLFSVVLGPGSDGAHEDHFHFDLGPWRLCK
jgi:hypothetical protein